ncbi:MAG: 23S rRNA (guanosine(2251)-2'-O)-methyltransferase RlmB [Candidatus Methylomirabilaceae bacterium]
MKESGDLLLGPHAVLEALRAGGRSIGRILVSRERSDARIVEIIRLATARGVGVRQEGRQRLDDLAKGVPHQGVLALVSQAAYEDPFELVGRIKAGTSSPLLVLLDGIQDPQNLGAIVRTGEAAGADGLFIARHRAVGITPAAARASVGAHEYLPVARIPGLPAFLEWLKGQGVWVLGADPNSQRSLYDIDLRVPLALVIGAEHRGLRVLVRERCDLLASIPMRGRLASLNAAAAAAIFLFEIRRQRDTQDHSGHTA